MINAADSLAGSSGMMLSLIAHIIRESKVEVDFVSPHMQSKPEPLNFRAL